MLSLTIGVLFVTEQPPQKIFIKLGLMEDEPEPPEPINYTLCSFNSCIEQLNYDTDVVFLGDSLTRRVNFQSAFTDKKILNLGLSGDTLARINDRCYLLKHLSPEKIFIMGGINGFSSNEIEWGINEYQKIIDAIMNDLPNSSIYIQSVLPVTNEKIEMDNMRSNEDIKTFNFLLKNLCEECDVTYIDLYSFYEKDGELNGEYEADGLHLNDEGKQLWIDKIRPYVYE